MFVHLRYRVFLKEFGKFSSRRTLSKAFDLLLPGRRFPVKALGALAVGLDRNVLSDVIFWSIDYVFVFYTVIKNHGLTD